MNHYDLIILGGGISGLGVAQQAARLGLSALICEAGTTCGATSDNTLRIIHGGFRYLQQLNVPRIVRSLKDQGEVLATYGDSVSPLPCLMPLAARGLKSPPFVRLAAITYGLFMRTYGSLLPPPTILSRLQLEKIAPNLAPLAPHGALCWYDVVMKDPRAIATKIIGDITQRGISIKENTRVTSVTRTPHGFETLTEDGARYTSNQVVSTLGPWIDSVALRFSDDSPSHTRPHPEWCLGFNIVVRRQLHPTHAIGVDSPDGRLLFCVPRGEHTAIGTWYTPTKALTKREASERYRPTIEQEEITRFIECINKALPSEKIECDDIVSIDAGVLPMKGITKTGPALYGEDKIYRSNGYTEVVSTKYTTFGSLGGRVVAKFT